MTRAMLLMLPMVAAGALWLLEDGLPEGLSWWRDWASLPKLKYRSSKAAGKRASPLRLILVVDLVGDLTCTGPCHQ